MDEADARAAAAAAAAAAADAAPAAALGVEFGSAFSVAWPLSPARGGDGKRFDCETSTALSGLPRLSISLISYAPGPAADRQAI